MRRLGRGFLWSAAFAMAGGLAWWGWSLGPAPRFVLSDPVAPGALGIFSRDGQRIALQLDEPRGTARVFDAFNGRMLYDRAESDWTVIRGHYDGDMYLFDPATPGWVNFNTIDDVERAESDPNRRRLFDQSPDLQTTVFDTNRGGQALVVTNGVRRAIALPPNYSLSSYTANGDVFVLQEVDASNHVIWDVRSDAPCFGKIEFFAYRLSKDRRFLAAWFVQDRLLHVFDLVQMTERSLSFEPRRSYGEIEFSPNSRFLVVDAMPSGETVIVDLQKPTRRFILKLKIAEGSDIQRPRFSEDGTRLTTSCRGNQMACWEFNEGLPNLLCTLGSAGVFGAEGKPVQRANLAARPVPGLFSTGRQLPPSTWFAISPDGKWAVVEVSWTSAPSRLATWMNAVSPAIASWFKSNDREDILIDLEESRCVAKWPSYDSAMVYNRFSSDNKSVAITHPDGRVSVFDLPPARRVLLPILMTLPLLALGALLLRKVHSWRRQSFSSAAGSTRPPSWPSRGATGSSAMP